jgi:alpha-L-arabinofuranosidase
MRTMIAISGASLALGLVTLAPVATSSPSRPTPHASPITRILVVATSDRGHAPTHLLGANHHFNENGYQVWDQRTNAPVPRAVKGARRAGLQVLRFPGGTVANLYDWKRAIGPDRGCQVVGPHHRRPARALTSGLAFGPDEFMRFVRMAHADPIIMVPFVTETAQDAADWVEYMNAPAGVPGNPLGGTDWADVRAANGHPAPYGVRWWEIGNEQAHGYSRYWMSADNVRARRQYLFGGARDITAENLGKDCSHPRSGVRSDGQAHQVFDILYPPVAPASLRLVIDGRVWTRLSDLSVAGPHARVFTLDATSGRVTFGDGVHGAIPSHGRTVRASYRSVHEGYFAFVHRMKAVDPSLKVCATWDTPAFAQAMTHRSYDCLSQHAIFSFRTGRDARPRWSGPLEGHDVFMLKAERVRERVVELRRAMASSAPLILTEFVAMHGDARAYPAWATSESHAVYMASLWADWLKLRIPLGTGDDFLWVGKRGMLGPAPDYTFTADAVTRRTLSPMFSAGGVLLRTHVSANPLRRPVGGGPSYRALSIAATRGHGVVRLLVVNRLPKRAVPATIHLSGRRTQGRATIRSAFGPSFTSWNRPGRRPSIVLHRRHIRFGAREFRHVFPAASTTVIQVSLRSG